MFALGTVGWSFVALVILLIIQTPVGVALGMSSVVGFYLLTESMEAATSLLLSAALDITSSPSFIVIPLFILMGALAGQTGIIRELFAASNKLFARLPGGLAIASVVTAAGFATVSGSSISATATMAKIALPEMKRFGYKTSLIVGSIACSGTLAMIIPPSIVMVFYGIVAQVPIGKLLIAGLLPGLLTVAVYSVQIIIRASINPAIAPAGERVPLPQAIGSMARSSSFFLILLVLILGILTGFWTATEAASAGVLVVILIGVARRALSSSRFLQTLMEAVTTTAALLPILIGSLLFGKMLALSGLTAAITEYVIALNPSPFMFFLALLALYLVLGTFMEGISIIALTVPILLPLLSQMGWDPIWFGIIVVKMIEIGAVTPPIGLNLFAFRSVAPEVPLAVIAKGSLPFLLCEVFILMLLYIVPEIVLVLPEAM